MQGGDNNHREVSLPATLKKFNLAIYVYSGMPTPDVNGTLSVPDFALSFSLMKKNKLAEKVYYDIKVLIDSARLQEENTKEFFELKAGLKEICSVLDFRDNQDEEFEKSLQQASKLADEFFQTKCQKRLPQVACVGHTHIDIAWLWTIRQTREKAQRSFATVIALMDRFPEYKFTSSQPALYQYVKEESPALYERIKKAVREGRWEAEGAMWVEADCNLASGESLVRQLLKGKKFFQDEFGIDSKILWLPDAFGYSAALPQILRKSGVDTFITSKISWNDTNTIPYDVFNWQGIDGTEIFSTFLTAQDKIKGESAYMRTTYNASGTPAQILGAWDRMQQKDLTNEALISYGYGDGGGGSTPKDIQQIKRMSCGIPGIPTATFDTVSNYAARLKENCREEETPKWVGELYLEFHRGTYTSQATTKKYNRKCEFAYSNWEALSVFAESKLDEEYPSMTLQNAWEILLTYQFHDILPGSSIKEVYEETDKNYQTLLTQAEKGIQTILENVASRVNANGGFLVYNPNSFVGDGFVEWDGEYYRVSNIPSKGYKVVELEKPKNTVIVDGRYLENEYYRINFDDNYEIESIYYKKQDRELVKAGKKANVLTAYNEYPSCFDAWEIRKYYKNKKWRIDDLQCVSFVDEGARKGIKITRKFCESTITQTIYLYENFDRIDFVNELDWQTEHIFLKTAFPFAINTSKAVCDIQFGNVERNTHTNTSWEQAKFEVCAHKYADVSDGGFGVALLNDCKYGYSIDGNEVSLTLLKCPTYPHKGCDKGRHTFIYSLYAHEKNALDCEVVKRAYDLNNPMQLVKVEENKRGDLPDSFSLVSVEQENIVIETVKKAENGSGYIVRAYESANKRTNAKICLGIPVKRVWLTDLMENKTKELQVKDGRLEVPFGSYEIQTLYIE